MNFDANFAPGWPGSEPRWTSSAKCGVGCALNGNSRVWFTLGYGIIDEVYYPRPDQACIRDLGLLVTDRRDFFSEEKRDTTHEVQLPFPGVPYYKLINTCKAGRYRIVKEVIADPRRDTVLQRCTLEILSGDPGDYALFALLAPHLGNRGSGNTGWIGAHKGVTMLQASGNGSALALASSVPWIECSAGFVGSTDGWQDLSLNRRLTKRYLRAENGNIALTGEIRFPLDAADIKDKSFVLALGFGQVVDHAAHRALASIRNGFDEILDQYVSEWTARQKTLLPLGRSHGGLQSYHVSAMVLRAHEAKEFPGGAVASLSIPWGSERGDNDLGGYHVVWSRDLVQTIGGLLAAGATADAKRAIEYLYATQEEDGSWPQNMWLDGTPHWGGRQLDETALPILLLDLATREGCLNEAALERLWPMARRAASYMVQNGPVSDQDRWEENQGYSTFTLATAIAALLIASGLAAKYGDQKASTYLLETADYWNDRLEYWTYSTDPDVCRALGIDGYYVRLSPPDEDGRSRPVDGRIDVRNRPAESSNTPADHVISPDALALVRFGLRSPDDPRILNTVKAIDQLLKVETKNGPCWHRYNGDGYGEHVDGTAFDGTGVGRAWPILTGERAHYELAAGNRKDASRLLEAFEAFAGDGFMLPEQVWDSEDVPDKFLFNGRPTGSAMPLAWSHAEHVKLLRSMKDGRIFDQPPQTHARYVTGKTESHLNVWSFKRRVKDVSQGKTLRIETNAPVAISWTSNGWKTKTETASTDSGLGVFYRDIPTDTMAESTEIKFTLFWTDAQKGEGTEFTVLVVA